MRDEAERAGRLPVAVVRAVQRARLFDLFLPRALGGLDVDLVTGMKIVEQLARADAGCAWNVAIGASFGAYAAQLEPRVAREVYGSRRSVVAGTLHHTGRAVAVRGGFRLSGTWSFGSGIHHASWVVGGCVVEDEDGPVRDGRGLAVRAIAFLPIRDVAIKDDWRVLGLQASGSCDYSADDVFVPTRRLVIPRDPSVDIDNLLACILTGIGLAALDAVQAIVARRPELAQRPVVAAAYARAETRLQAARQLLFLATAPGQGLDSLCARIHAADTVVDVVTDLFSAAGTAAIHVDNNLERLLRDAHVANQHIAFSRRGYEFVGRERMRGGPQPLPLSVSAPARSA